VEPVNGASQFRLDTRSRFRAFWGRMKLQALAVKNFRVLKEAHLSFPDQVIGIIGPNGAGKSSLVEAVAWALYGNRVARSGKEEIKSTYAGPYEDCEVCLEFEVGREHYRLKRQLIGRRGRSEVSLYRDGQCDSVGSTETERYVTELLGLDWRGFLTSFLARQQELNALADLSPGRRREHLAGMLGIDRLDQALRRVKDDRRLLQQTAAAYEQQRIHLDLVSSQLVEVREHARALENQQDSLAGAYETAKQFFRQAERQHREQQEKKAACSQLEARLETCRSTERPLASQLESLCSREKRLLESKKQMKELAGRVEKLDRLKADLTELEKSRENQARLTELRNRAEALARERDENQQALVERQAELNSAEKQLAEIPTNVAEQWEAVTVRLEQARSRWAEIRAESGANEKTLAALDDQIISIEQVGPEAVCERCRRPFGDDLDQIKKHLKTERAELVATGAELDRNLAVCKQDGDRLKKEETELQRQTQVRRALEPKLQSLRREINGIVSRQQMAAKALTGIAEQIAGVGEVSFDPERMRTLKEKVDRLEQARIRVSELKGELNQLPEVRASIVRTQEQLTRLGGEMADLGKQLADLGYDEAVAVQTAGEFADRQKALDTARNACLEGSKELELTRREIKSKEEELGRLAEAGVRLEECRTDQFYAEKLTSLFSDFRKYTISRIRPRLAELSSQLITEMSGGRYSFVELDEDYNLQIMDSGRYFGIERFSGGEKDLASLGLRLAISLALTESAGLEHSFVILDEVFGSQDMGRRELIFQSLARLKERFPQMILVTHLEELKHKVETLIELVPQPGGWSEVRVNGDIV